MTKGSKRVAADTPQEPARTLRLRLDNNALAGNWRALSKLSGAADTGAAVKANAYGLGVEIAVPVLREAGAQSFFVAHWSEVAGVLAHAPASQVSVLHGPLTHADARFAQDCGVRPVINSLRQASIWLEAGGGECDLMIDTGINRLGLPMKDIGDPLIARLKIDTLMSHLASADEDNVLNALQLQRFGEVSAMLSSKRRSLANSAGIALGPSYAFDLTRPGLALYGGVPRGELNDCICQVAYPQAAIIQIRQIVAGESVGYNAAFTAGEPMRIGTVSIGYADGFLRCWAGKGALTHGDVRLPILGKVSMDMVVVDLGAAPDLKEGDWLGVPYALPEASALTGLSQYELLTILGARFAT